MKQLDFNTLDQFVASNSWQTMARQAVESIASMQRPAPQFGIQPHVVLPIFEKKDEMQYVLAVNEEQRGPFSKAQVQQMLDAGVITGEYFFWHQGMPEWTLIKNSMEFKQ